MCNKCGKGKVIYNSYADKLLCSNCGNWIKD